MVSVPFRKKQPETEYYRSKNYSFFSLIATDLDCQHSREKKKLFINYFGEKTNVPKV